MNIDNINPDFIIQSERTLKFPQNLVFSAWANPDILKKWWGPKGFTNTFEKFQT